MNQPIPRLFCVGS